MTVASPAPGGTPGQRLHPDETPPAGGGIFRRIAPSSSSPAAAIFGVFEGVFAPAARQARDEIQRQRAAGARNPADTDPPDDDTRDDVPGPRVVAAGRSGTPFSGTILINRRVGLPAPSQD
jgi:hypothetical protein